MEIILTEQVFVLKIVLSLNLVLSIRATVDLTLMLLRVLRNQTNRCPYRKQILAIP